MKVADNIFREYDIRGVAGDEFSQKAIDEYQKWYGKFEGVNITPEVAEAIGKAYGTIIQNRGGKKIVIGHEKRPYGKELKQQFIKGVQHVGIDVDDVGITLTPVIYFTIAYKGYDGGVNVTGSHNVYFFNGFKTMARDVYPIFGDELQEMRKMIEEDDYFETDITGKYLEIDVFSDYKEYLLNHNKLQRKLKIVTDCGNGSAGIFAPNILRELGCEVIELYSEADASFPNHVPDPEDEFMMTDLKKAVVDNKADIGVGFDADGDRCGFINEKGEFIYADRLILLLSKDILSRNQDKKILYDVKCTRLLKDLLPEMDGIPLMHVTGHAPIKQTLRDDEAVIFAGEVSGHFYFVEDYFRIDDGVYSAAKVLSLISQSEKSVSELTDQFPQTVMTPELKLPCDDHLKFEIVEKIKNVFEIDYECITIDGVRVIFSDTSWALVRASNTSPYLTIRMEADTEEELLRIKNIVADELEKHEEIGDKLNRKEVTTHTGRLGWV